MKLVSKYRFLSGLQCPKFLRVHYHDKSRSPPTDPDKQASLDQEKVVG